MDKIALEQNFDMAKEFLLNNNQEGYKQAFEEAAGDYIRTVVREESIIERILKPIEVSMNHPKMQKDKNSDTMYYLEDVEQNATAMEVSIRGDWAPRFINQKRYDIRFGKIETEELKKEQTELMVADNLISMIKQNNAESIRRAQDIVGMRAIDYAINQTGNHIGTADAASTVIDWTNSVSKRDFSNLMNVISDQELIPAKFLMSDSTWNIIASTPFNEIGETAGRWFVDGIKEKRLIDLPVELTVKTNLQDVNGDLGNTNFFKTVNQHGTFHHIYLFVDPAYLGKMIRLGQDYVWSKWEKSIFMWSNWRQIGIGFGNIKGLARMTVKVA